MKKYAMSARTGQRISLAVSVLAIGVFCGAQPSPAQVRSSEPAPDVTLKTATSGALEEIIVTARRRQEPAQKVPTVIAAISGAALTDRSIKNVSEIQFLVPTLRVTSSLQAGQDINFTLRGLRSNGVVVYFSEVPARGSIVGRELYDIGSVQVLKGPQGTLFGKNTTAGAILFGPARPEDKTAGYVEFGAGNYNMKTGQAMLNTPITDGLFLRVAGQFLKRDGFTKYVGAGNGIAASNSTDSVSGRASLLFKPTDAFENLFILDSFNADEIHPEPKIVGITPCPTTPTFTQTVILGDCRYPGWANFFNAETAVGARNTLNPFEGKLHTNSWGVSNLTTARLNDQFTVKNIFGYREASIRRVFDGEGTIFPLFVTDAGYKYRFYSDELQLQAEIDRLKLIVGGFYSNNRVRANELFNVAQPSFLDPITRYGTLKETSKALFTQATYSVTDRLNVTAGFRYTWEDKTFLQHDFTGALGCSYNTNDIFAANVDFAKCEFLQTVKYKEPSWTFAADYRVTDKVLAYATARRGFNSGGINSSPPTAYGTEKIDDIEIGVKSDVRIGDIPARLNLSAFRSKYKGIQRQNTTFVGGQPKSFIENAAAATVKGVELDSRFKFGAFDLAAAASYLDASYDRFFTDIAPGVAVDVSGNKLAQAPKWSTSVTAAYHIPVSEKFAEDVALSVTWSYQSTIYFEDFNTNNTAAPNYIDPFNTQTGYSLWNAELNFKHLFGRGLGATIFAKNIGDKLYSQNRTSALSSFGYATAIWGEPRTWGITLNYRFGE